MAIKVIKKGEYAPKLDGDYIYISIEADDAAEAASYTAKKAAYDARVGLGAPKAGVNEAGTPVRVMVGKKVKYVRTFKLMNNPSNI
jgi:hypothetical protein